MYRLLLVLLLLLQPLAAYAKSSAAILYDHGVELYNRQQYEEALAEFREVLRIEPDFPLSAKARCGDALFQLERYEEAITQYQQALRDDHIDSFPGERYSLVNLGHALYELKRYEEAIAEFKKINSRYIDFTDSRYKLGQVYWKLGRWADVVREWEEVLRIDPNHLKVREWLPKARARLRLDTTVLSPTPSPTPHGASQSDTMPAAEHYSRGLALAKLKRYEEAAAEYREAIRLISNDSNSRYGLGNALYELNRYEDAIAAYRGSIRLKPNFADAHFSLGSVYWKLGRWAACVREYEETLRIDPNHKLAIEWLPQAREKLKSTR